MSDIAGYLVYDGNTLVGSCRLASTAVTFRAQGLRVTAVYYDPR